MFFLLVSNGSYNAGDFQFDLTIYFVLAYGLLAFGLYLLFFPRAPR
ncbi:MAG: hypothetical protein INR62_04530 [Rhodospirillales bacterium]|nr:hypothetical protein [Acetobacter sp.]